MHWCRCLSHGDRGLTAGKAVCRRTVRRLRLGGVTPDPEFRYHRRQCLRTARDNEQLWQRVCDGTINSIVSDHCAFPLQEKLAAKSCFAALPGIPGTETIFPLLYTEGRRRGLTVQDIVRLFSAEPARLFGLYPRKGCLAVGSDADLFMLDPEARGALTWKDLHSRSGYTVYEGWETEGRIELVMRRGKIIMRHGRMQETSPGGVFLPCCQNS